MLTKDPITWQDLTKMLEDLPISFADLAVLLDFRSPPELRDAVLNGQVSIWYVNGVLAAAFPLAAAVSWPYTITYWPQIRALLANKYAMCAPITHLTDMRPAMDGQILPPLIGP